MTVLLDENFPLGLLRSLQHNGVICEHIITLGWRGASDTRIREYLQDSDRLFLTQDADFLFGESVGAIVVVSRVRQARPLRERIRIWCNCIAALLEGPRPERLFELFDDGTLLPWQEVTRRT